MSAASAAIAGTGSAASGIGALTTALQPGSSSRPTAAWPSESWAASVAMSSTWPGRAVGSNAERYVATVVPRSSMRPIVWPGILTVGADQFSSAGSDMTVTSSSWLEACPAGSVTTTRLFDSATPVVNAKSPVFGAPSGRIAGSSGAPYAARTPPLSRRVTPVTAPESRRMRSPSRLDAAARVAPVAPGALAARTRGSASRLADIVWTPWTSRSNVVVTWLASDSRR